MPQLLVLSTTCTYVCGAFNSCQELQCLDRRLVLFRRISKTAFLPDVASFAGKMCAIITPPLALLWLSVDFWPCHSAESSVT